MALRQIMLNKKLEQRTALLTSLKEQEETFATRSQELEQAIEEASTDEEIQAVEESITALDNEKSAFEEKKTTLEGEIAELESELEQLNSKQPTTQKRSSQKEEGTNMNRLHVRELFKTGEYFERSEVKDFYEQFKNIRAIGGGELTIPEIIVNRIMDIMGDFTTLYPLVDKIQVKGTTRILIDTDTDAATWLEQKGTLPTGDVGTIGYLDFDGYKVGKVTFVDNYLLQDSIINLDAYVTKKIARAIAKALDKAIIHGEGAVAKQPEGIIPSLPMEKKLTTGYDENFLKAFVSALGEIDSGDDSVGEIVIVMNRRTYYRLFAPFSIQVDSTGNVVGKLPNLKNPDVLGLPVVFNNNLQFTEILLGDFSQYTLVERESITIDSSEHVKFVEDQTAFRGKGRFDGKPTRPDAFVLLTVDPMMGGTGGSGGEVS